jgi:Predicted periplasmic lipoprotein (DUF2279)
MTPKERINLLSKIFSKDASAATRVKAVLMFSLGIYTLLMLALGFAWYSNQWGSSFHFFNDAAEWKQMDKFAHFFWSFQTCALATRLMTWTQMDPKKALITGSLMGFLFVSSIEVFDGFSNDYGASVYDVIANAAGCGVFIAQRMIWKKVVLWPKFSFHPTSFAPLRPNMLGDGFLEEILKDYNGQTFWYSANFKIIPMPSWLTIAFGVGAEGMVYSRDSENELMNLSPHRKYFLSLDLNLSDVKTSSPVMNFCLRIFNIIKFPAPTIEFSTEGVRFHPIYF